MTSLEAVPLVVVALLLLSTGGTLPATVEIVFEGAHASTGGALVVAGGEVTVPEAVTLDGDVVVVGGTFRVEGRVAGDVTLLAGRLAVADGATVTGELQTVGGRATVSDGATVGRLTAIDVTPREPSPGRSLAFSGLQAATVAVVAAVLVRRRPTLLDTVGTAITHHPTVCGVVGALAATTLLVLFVYMAFTIVLLPVSVVGLLAELAIAVYAVAVYGHLVGQRLPIARPDLAAALGAVAVVVAFDLLGRLPALGVAVQGVLLAIGFGAVLVTYFGLQPFEPPTIPG